MLPAYVANVTPVAVRNHFNKLDFPLDFNKTWRGKPILGRHKTFRGFFFGVLFGTLVFYIQKIIGIESIINYSDYNIILGFLLSFGALAGDSIKSFFKRRVGIKSGNSWIPFDQMDYVLGALLFSVFLVKYSWWEFSVIILISVIGHIVISHLAFYLKIREEKW